MNNKGMMRIKLLAVILIIGLVSFVVIPSLYNYYKNKKNEDYINIALEYINEVKTNISSLSFKQIPLENEALLVKLSSLDLDKKSPYGTFQDEYSYVIVLNKGNYYDYYFASTDSANYGIPLIGEKELTKESVVYGKSKLTNIEKASNIKSLYVANTVFEVSNDTKEDDVNLLLSPVSGELTVSYDFMEDVHDIYDTLVKNIDTSIYNKEATINNGVLKYDNKELASNYDKDISGMFRYLSFPNNDEKLYYASFVSYTSNYVAGVINESGDYSSKNIVFDSIPTIAMNKSAKVVNDDNKNYLMWNMMAIYPNNDNYTISECGAIILKDNNATNVDLTLDTPNVLVGKSNNNCELGNIFAIRKDNISVNDRWFARGYIKYTDKLGNEYVNYSKDVVSALVK